LVNLKTKSAGDGYPKKAIEKAVLRFLGSRTFSHGLAPQPPFNLCSALGDMVGNRTFAPDFRASRVIRRPTPAPWCENLADRIETRRHSAVKQE
jgi:hypothetical protein